ncbi:hypothetical protein BLA29_000375 [Euroglyphus maynei]|uniref:MBD domain-containing protein n=1 Tax=Euroglyphus maynei TaxID=6958 RepID=A0A1Y3BM44_EURMA|nr:hypothetical protein BLA29_000375 [Euroglyphus maynei]
MENIDQEESLCSTNLESNSSIRIPYQWKRKLLTKCDKIYYVTPSGHILLSNSDVYNYLADPNTCKCSLDPSSTFDEVFNFDSKIQLNIQIDDCKTNESPCEQWFQSFRDINEFRSLLLDMNKSGKISADQHSEQWSKNDDDDDDDDKVIPVDILEASTQISKEIERLESEIISDDLNYFRDIIEKCSQLPQMSNNLTDSDNRIVKYLNDIIQSATSFQFVENSHSIIFEYGDPIIKMVMPTAILNSLLKKHLDWSVTTLDWLKENFPIFLAIQINVDQNNYIGPFDHINPFAMFTKTISDNHDDNNADRPIENDESAVKDENQDLQKSEDNNFDDELCYSLLSTKPSTIDIDSSCSSIPIEVIEDLDDGNGHNSIMLTEHIDSQLLLNSGHEHEEINFEIRLENLNDNACYQMTMNIPKNLLELDDDQNHEHEIDTDWNNDVGEQQRQHSPEIQLDPGQVELISNIIIEKNDSILNEPPEPKPQQEIIFNSNEQSAENRCDIEAEIDDCSIIKEIIENSIIQTATVIVDEESNDIQTSFIENELENIDDEITDEDYDDDNNPNLDLLHDPNEILEMGTSSSSSTRRSLDELKSREKYYQRLQRLKRQLEIQGMPGTLSSDEKVRLSPPLPPQERIFNVGDLVWGPFGDVRLWPGKLVSVDNDVNESAMGDNSSNDEKVGYFCGI